MALNFSFRTSNDWSPSQTPSNSCMHLPLITSKPKVRSCDDEIKINNCNITKPCTDIFKAFFISSQTFTSHSFKCPTSFSPFQLDQSGYRLPIHTPISIYWHSCSRHIFHHSWHLKQQTQWIFHFQNFEISHFFFANTLCRSMLEWLHSVQMPTHESNSQQLCSHLSN